MTTAQRWLLTTISALAFAAAAGLFAGLASAPATAGPAAQSPDAEAGAPWGPDPETALELYDRLQERERSWADQPFSDDEIEDQLRRKIEQNPVRQEAVERALDALRRRARGEATEPLSAARVAQIEDFRDKFAGFMLDSEQLLEALPEAYVFDNADRLAHARGELEVLPVEDLDLMEAVFYTDEQFWKIPEDVYAQLYGGGSVAQNDLLAPALPDIVPTVPPEGSLDLERSGCRVWADTPTCPDPGCPPPIPFEARIAISTVNLGVNAACDYIPDDVLIGTVDVPFGFICAAIKDALANTEVALEGAHAVHLECEDNYHRGMLHAFLDETVSSRASQISFDFFVESDLRLDMERDLLNTLDSRVSQFQLPASEGGYLDRTDGISVRSIVTDTIYMNELAGYDVQNAHEEYAAAEVHLASGEYKEAYSRYRKAYRAASDLGRLP